MKLWIKQNHNDFPTEYTKHIPIIVTNNIQSEGFQANLANFLYLMIFNQQQEHVCLLWEYQYMSSEYKCNGNE